MPRILKLSLIVLTFISLALPLFITRPVIAESAQQEACDGITQGTGANPTDCTSSSSGDTLGHIINRIINVMTLVLGAVSIVMIIVGGFRYVTSAGNDQALAAAKNTIIYALIGLIVASIAQVLIRFVLTTANPKPQSTSSLFLPATNRTNKV